MKKESSIEYSHQHSDEEKKVASEVLDDRDMSLGGPQKEPCPCPLSAAVVQGLECPVCLSLPRGPPIVSCTRGHSLCRSATLQFGAIQYRTVDLCPGTATGDCPGAGVLSACLASPGLLPGTSWPSPCWRRWPGRAPGTTWAVQSPPGAPPSWPSMRRPAGTGRSRGGAGRTARRPPWPASWPGLCALPSLSSLWSLLTY